MNRIYSLAASAVMMLWAVGPAHGAPKPKDESPSAEAQTIFEHIDAQSATIADTAFTLGEMARTDLDAAAHLDRLDVVRDDVNKIGSELRSLEAMRDSLSEWEAKALDQIEPLMNEVAGNAQKAIRTFNSDQRRLQVSSYIDETASVSKDADEVATLLRNYLKLAKTREKEMRLEHSLGESSGS